MWQAGRVLLLGDSRAYLSMYNILQAADRKCFQLDRVETECDPADIGKAVKEAMVHADCLLLSHKQLCNPGFPVHMFSGVIEYAPQAALEPDTVAAAAKLLSVHPRLHWSAFMLSDTQMQDVEVDVEGFDSEPGNRPCESRQGPEVAQAGDHWYVGAATCIPVKQGEIRSLNQTHSEPPDDGNGGKPSSLIYSQRLIKKLMLVLKLKDLVHIGSVDQNSAPHESSAWHIWSSRASPQAELA